MSALALATRRYTFAEWQRILADPIASDDYPKSALYPVIKEFLAWKRLSNAADRTLATYEWHLAQLAVRLPEGIGIEDIEVEHLMLALEPVPRGSWRLHRTIYNQLFKWAIRHGRRSALNPVELLPDLLRQNTTPVYEIFTEGEQAAIVNASRFMDDPARDRVRALILLDGGIRKGEARGLLTGDVDPTTRRIIVRGKGDKQRLVPIRGDLWQAWEQSLLTPYPRTGELPDLLDHVWFGMRVAGAYKNRERQVTAIYPERPISERGFHEWWVRLCGHAGVKYRKPHMTRHTYATDALDASPGDLYGVKEVLGHSSTKVTEIYLHSSTRRMESVADNLARSRRGQN